ncbi:MAG: hypothetical protein U9R79_04155 [Armatimonadota bacterium]|nr:hypothetical protein [Armatimonadota bacterium]
MLPIALGSPGCGEGDASENRSHIIDVGSRKQLFIDDMLMDSSRGIRLTMNPPRKTGEVLITADEPWEDGGGVRGLSATNTSILREGGLFRVWYDSLGQDYDHLGSDFRQIGYAESEDGIHFVKPSLGIVEIGGSTANNIVIRENIGGGVVWIDPRASEHERYRSLRKTRPSGELALHSSPDGVHWTLTRTTDIGHCDTQSIAFWDDAYQCYVLYTRRWVRPPETEHAYRIFRRLESTDLVEWRNEEIVLAADEQDLRTHDTPQGYPPVDYYGGAVFKYEEAPDVYFMLAQAFWHWHPRNGGEGWAPATMDVRLCASRDGKRFERLGHRRPFIPLGAEGEFDSRLVWAMPNPIRVGDELWIYYVGTNRDHDGFIDPAAPDGRYLGAVSRAVLRLDGFVSADAGYAGGEIVTPPIRFEGSRLELNVNTSGGGSVVVELLDESGAPIPGYTRQDATPVNGSSVRMPVSWGGSTDVSALSRRPIRMRLLMQDCRLYAFQFS